MKKVGGAFFALLFPLIYLGAMLIVEIIAMVIMIIVNIDDLTSEYGFNDLINSFMSGNRLAIPSIISAIVGTGFAFLLAKKAKGIKLFENKPFDIKLALLCLLTALGGAFGLEYIATLIFPNSKPAENPIQNEFTFWIAVYAAIIAPICEELIFRKFMIDSAKKSRVPAPVICIMSGVVFAVVHDPTSAVYLFVTFVIGLIMALIYYKTNNILYPIILHAVNNTLSCVFMYLYEKDSSALDILEKEIWYIAGIAVFIISSAGIFLITKKNKNIDSLEQPIFK